MDRSGGELADGKDEILVPHDMNWDDPLKDDDLGAIFKGLPAGAFLTMIRDARHSGTMTKALKRPSVKHWVNWNFLVTPP